jgi:hypothetical protein
MAYPFDQSRKTTLSKKWKNPIPVGFSLREPSGSDKKIIHTILVFRRQTNGQPLQGLAAHVVLIAVKSWVKKPLMCQTSRHNVVEPPTV